MQTCREFAQIVKQAADKLASLQGYVETQKKEGVVDSLITNMREKGLVDDKSAADKRKELLKSDDKSLEVHKKALDLIGGKPIDIASNTKRSAQGSPESAFDNWVFGG